MGIPAKVNSVSGALKSEIQPKKGAPLKSTVVLKTVNTAIKIGICKNRGKQAEAGL